MENAFVCHSPLEVANLRDLQDSGLALRHRGVNLVARLEGVGKLFLDETRFAVRLTKVLEVICFFGEGRDARNVFARFTNLMVPVFDYPDHDC